MKVVQTEFLIMSVSKYILDIEGTVCPISFVKDVLFPYFSEKVPEIVKINDGEKPADANIASILNQFPGNMHNDQLVSYILELVRKDVKDPVLKQLQGYIWAEGYRSGAIKAPIYKDAIDFIRRKQDVYIYSSGSVKAQKLLFNHVEDPRTGQTIDLQPEIRDYFDINTSGKKTEASSYHNILKDIGMDNHPEQVMFISDNVLELHAAVAAGLKTILAVRPGNAPVEDIFEYDSVTDFTSI